MSNAYIDYEGIAESLSASFRYYPRGLSGQEYQLFCGECGFQYEKCESPTLQCPNCDTYLSYATGLFDLLDTDIDIPTLAKGEMVTYYNQRGVVVGYSPLKSSLGRIVYILALSDGKLESTTVDHISRDCGVKQ